MLQSRRLRYVSLSLLILMGIGTVVFSYWGQNSTPSSRSPSPQPGSAAEAPQLPADSSPAAEEGATRAPDQPPPVTEPTPPDQVTEAQIQQTVLGEWQSEYYGTRYLTIRDDGTATIYFQASTFASMFVGSRLTIHYTWGYDVEKQQVVFTTTGGYPQSSLDYVNKMWGSDQRQTVITICEQELHLVDLDGKTEHRWKKIPEIPETVVKVFEAIKPK